MKLKRLQDWVFQISFTREIGNFLIYLNISCLPAVWVEEKNPAPKSNSSINVGPHVIRWIAKMNNFWCSLIACSFHRARKEEAQSKIGRPSRRLACRKTSLRKLRGVKPSVNLGPTAAARLTFSNSFPLLSLPLFFSPFYAFSLFLIYSFCSDYFFFYIFLRDSSTLSIRRDSKLGRDKIIEGKNMRLLGSWSTEILNCYLRAFA